MLRLKRTVVIAVASAGLSLCTVTGAAAAPPAACKSDVQKFCPGVPAGGGHVLTCLEEHTREITSDCRAALEGAKRHVAERHAGRAKPPAWVSPCLGDIDKLCKDLPAGEGRITECLAQHRASLSDGCKTAFGSAAK